MIRQSLRFLISAFRDFVFPPVCLGCDRVETEDGLVCPICRDKLGRHEPAVRPPGHAPGVSHLRAVGTYSEPCLRLIHELKYRGRKKLADVLGTHLAGLLLNDTVLRQADLLVPVPLHPARRRERGYNQAELLARAVSGRTGIPVGNVLRRVRNTRSQVNLTPEQRRANLAGAFHACPGITLAGRRVVLVDDVTTTGATLSAAARVLHDLGASQVSGLVVADARPARGSGRE
jgi:ComF family protein